MEGNVNSLYLIDPTGDSMTSVPNPMVNGNTPPDHRVIDVSERYRAHYRQRR